MKNFASLMFTCLFIVSCNCSVNKPVHIADGTNSNSGYASVNGSITIGTLCNIKGDCSSVNGRITVGDNSTTGDLNAVNGRIELMNNVTVNGSVTTVNGRFSSGEGGKISGSLSTINGKISLQSTHVGKNLSTINGDISLTGSSNIDGSIIIKKPGSQSHKQTIEIFISDDSIVEGDIIVKDKSAKVRVFISGNAQVKGTVENAEVINQ